MIDGAPKYNFAGSNQLQLQIERGAPADLFASASPAEPAALFREGKCTRPVTFATNVLVMVTPKDNPAGLRSVYALRSGHHRLAVGTAGVPIGAYTRQLLRRMQLTSILSTNTVSLEPNVNSIIAKVGARLRRRRLRRTSPTTWSAKDRAARVPPADVGAAAGPLPDVRREAPGRRHRRPPTASCSGSCRAAGAAS